MPHMQRLNFRMLNVLRTLGSWCLLVALCGCEAAITISGSVTVPPDVRRQFSPEKPGILLFREDLPQNRAQSYVLGVLCEPGNRDLVVPIELRHIGCAMSGSVAAWIETGEPNALPGACGIGSLTDHDGAAFGERMAEAQQVVFADNVDCAGGTATIDLRVQALTPSPTPTAPPTPAVDANQLLVTDTFEGVIFAAASAERAGLETLVYETIDGYWTPSRDDVLAFEQRLGHYLQQAAPQTYPGPLRDLSTYRRQYVGILVEGQRVVFANFFCNADDTDWKREIVAVLDGGSCYFEVKYNVHMGTFYDLSIHGEA